ncbi:MAG: hypothetical protein R6U63_11735 [Longimicrobiales bacterium]
MSTHEEKDERRNDRADAREQAGESPGGSDHEPRHIGPVGRGEDEIPADLEEFAGTAARGPGAVAPEDQPLGISLLTWLYWFWSGATVIFLLSLIPGDQPVPIAGETITRTEALGRVLPVFLPIGLAAIGAALALTLRRSWARPAVLLPVILAAFGPALSGMGTSTTDTIFGIVVVLAILVGLIWYLYFRARTVAYFERLKDDDEGPAE